MTYFESHAHYDDRRFNADRDELLPRLHAEGISHIINVGADMASSQASMELASRYDFIYAAVGVHPHDAKNMADKDLDRLKSWSRHSRVVAIGEIGLDFHYDFSPRDIQERRFREQLELCEELNLPVIIHSREADQLTFDIIRQSKVRRGVVHCYGGSAEMALRYVELGFMIGVGGIVTYPNARRLVETVAAVPAEAILAETDCPYLPPVPHRGSRNSSEYLRHIVTEISEIRQISEGDAALCTSQNAQRLFSL